MASREWAGTTYGNGWMHRQLTAMLRHVDVRVFYAFTAVFVVPVCLLINRSRGVIYHYLRRRHGFSACKAARLTYVNHCLFAQAVIDKFAMYAGRKPTTVLEGYDHYLRLEAQAPGFVQLSSHIGNYEVAGYSLTAHHKPMNAVVFAGEKATVMAERSRMLAVDNIRLIPVSDDLNHVFAINTALSEGEVVSMPADRMFGSKRGISVNLLGAQAVLPAGPFATASMRQLDVLAVNVMKTATTTYTIFVTPLPYDKAAPARQRAAQLAQAYADELTRILRRWPTQWYNFFDFWKA